MPQTTAYDSTTKLKPPTRRFIGDITPERISVGTMCMLRLSLLHCPRRNFKLLPTIVVGIGRCSDGLSARGQVCLFDFRVDDGKPEVDFPIAHHTSTENRRLSPRVQRAPEMLVA